MAARVGPRAKLERWEAFATAALGGIVADPDYKADEAADFAANCADGMLRLWLQRVERTNINGKGPLPEDG